MVLLPKIQLLSDVQYIIFVVRKLPQQLPHCSKYFNLNSCKLKTPSDKMETARGHFQLHENILAHTCENSLGLYQYERKTYQMLAGDWQNFGRSLLPAIIRAWSCEPSHVVRKNIIQRDANKGRQNSRK